MKMNEWKEYRLGDLCTKIGSGATPKGGKEAYLEEGEFALVRSQNVLDFSFSYDGLAYINKEQASKLNNVALQQDDVLLNITGDSVARVCQVPTEILPARVNQHVAIIRPDTEKLDQKFLKYYLLNPQFKKFMLGLSSVGGTRNALTKVMIEDFRLHLPEINTQKRIASILSSLDEKIELNRQTAQTLEAIAQAIFKEWFVDFNFPGATGEMQESELGEIPKGWNIKKLGEIYKTTSGGTPSRTKLEYYENGNIPWVKSKELENTFIISTEEHITEEALKKSSAKLLPKHSVLIAMYGATVGEVGIISQEATCNQAICAFLPNDRYSYPFIYQYLLNNKADIISRAVGSAQQNISQDLLKRIMLVVPPTEILKLYHRTIESIFEKIENNVYEIRHLTKLRDSLLPKLIKGELTIN
ncbi:MAG: restriction endonuclease subunit S [Sphingobacteriales bacterium]|nr:MAG: restriction endonuclease subunit S [Sphingobacteriales bacterium]